MTISGCNLIRGLGSYLNLGCPASRVYYLLSVKVSTYLQVEMEKPAVLDDDDDDDEEDTCGDGQTLITTKKPHLHSKCLSI